LRCTKKKKKKAFFAALQRNIAFFKQDKQKKFKKKLGILPGGRVGLAPALALPLLLQPQL
jgi:hypothetical protein